MRFPRSLSGFPLLGLTFRLFALLPGRCLPRLDLVISGQFGLSDIGPDLLGDALHLLLAQRQLHRRQELLRLVLCMLTEGLLQLLNLRKSHSRLAA